MESIKGRSYRKVLHTRYHLLQIDMTTDGVGQIDLLIAEKSMENILVKTNLLEKHKKKRYSISKTASNP